jgi:hypothetical protein
VFASGTEKLGVTGRSETARRLISMMTHSLSESVLFLFCLLLFNHLLEKGQTKAVNVCGAWLGHILCTSMDVFFFVGRGREKENMVRYRHQKKVHGGVLINSYRV